MKRISDYTIYCTEEQTRKALNLGASIETKGIYPPVVNINNTLYFVPTAEQMVGWLEDAEIEIDIIKGIESYVFNLYFGQEYIDGLNGYNTRKEATLAAIDAALEYLTSKK